MAPTAINFWDRGTTDNISNSYLSFRISNLCSVSFLVGLTAYSGRINAIFLLPILTFYNLAYYFMLYLNILLSFSVEIKANSLRYLDDYGTNLVYLYGGAYALLVAIFTKRNL